MRPALVFLVAVWFTASALARPKPPLEIVVFSSGWTDENARATPDKPIYYVPMAGGYYAEGPGTGGDKSERVKMEEVWDPLQRYLAATKETPQPTQLVVFHWGVMSPDILSGANGVALMNHKTMGLLVGNTRVDRHLESEFGPMFQNAMERRYMIVVSAFDYAAATAKKKEKKVLWRTRLSVPLLDTSLQEAIVPLLSAGAPYFGRDSGQPKEVRWDRAKVQVGDPTVVRDAPADATPLPEKK
jgi:hypothetical protein